MIGLLRPLLLGLAVYGGYAVAFPDWVGTVYPTVTLSVIAGGAVAVWLLHKLLDIGGGAAKIGLELLFLGAIAVWIGTTMPQRSGKTPFEQWSDGLRPSRADVERGLRRLGVEGGLARRASALLPR